MNEKRKNEDHRAGLIGQAIPTGAETEPRLSREIELLIGNCEAIAKNARDRSDHRRIGYDGYNASFDSGYASALEHMADRLRQIQKKVETVSPPLSEASGSVPSASAEKTPVELAAPDLYAALKAIVGLANETVAEHSAPALPKESV